VRGTAAQPDKPLADFPKQTAANHGGKR
jgi:hypothetical protein